MKTKTKLFIGGSVIIGAFLAARIGVRTFLSPILKDLDLSDYAHAGEYGAMDGDRLHQRRELPLSV